MVLTLFKKHKIEVIVLFFIVLLYFATRLTNIMTLPIFTDEALYVRWTQIANQDANWRFISLTDGKQPLFIWLTMASMRFIEDPLLAGRIVSVFSGFFATFGMFFLGKEVFKNRWIGLISAFLYVIYPFALVYDRMALYDSLVGMFTIFGLLFNALLVRTLRLDVALILGMIGGGAVLTKTNGFFTIYLLPFSLLLFDIRNHQRSQRLLKWVILATVVLLFAYGYYSILRLSPFFYLINEKNALFVYRYSEWIQHPFTFLFGNLMGQFNWLVEYLSWPLLFFALGSFFVSSTFFRVKVLLILWFILPFVASALFGKTLYPRFIYFMTLPLLPLVSFSFWHLFTIIKNRYLFFILSAFALFFIIRTSYLVIFDFAHAPIPYSDVSQYNNNWPSGTGIREAIEFFREQAKDKKIFVGTQGTFGLLPHAFEIYLLNEPNITIQGYWPIDELPPKEAIEMSRKMPTYFAFYQPCTLCPNKGEAPGTWKVREVLKINKEAESVYFTVYQINPQ